MYLGDYAEDYADLNFKFTTRNSSFVPTSLVGVGSPAVLTVSVYKSNGTTESTAGVTLTTDFDTRTGLNNVKIDLSADAFYAAGEDYQVVLTSGEVNSVDVSGETLALFSIENRSNLTAAEVNAEVVDALATDTYAEPGQGAPAATASLKDKIGYLYKAWRNKKDQDGTTTQLYADDASTVDQKQTTGESGGTVTAGEWATGP